MKVLNNLIFGLENITFNNKEEDKKVYW